MRLLTASVLILQLLTLPAVAGDFEDGVKFSASKNYTKATQSFKKAAELGDAQAQFNLGAMYYEGMGVAQKPPLGSVRPQSRGWRRRNIKWEPCTMRAKELPRITIRRNPGTGKPQNRGMRRLSFLWGSCITRDRLCHRTISSLSPGFARPQSKGMRKPGSI